MAQEGTIQSIRFCLHSFGEQVVTIDGAPYVSWFDMGNPDLRGLGRGARVRYESQPNPTVLCNYPRVEVTMPRARILEVLKGGA